jgi:hypothetical protein
MSQTYDVEIFIFSDVARNTLFMYILQKKLFGHTSNISDLILVCFLLTYLEITLACFKLTLVTRS